MNKNAKVYRITPGWKAFGSQYLKAIAMIPLLGYGFFLLYKLGAKQKALAFEISDDDITKIENEHRTTIRLGYITKIKVLEAGLDSYLNVQRLYISTGEKEIVIPGLDNAEQLEHLLLAASEQDKKRMAHHAELEKKKPKYAPGSLEKMNDLVGLWQQGMLTDEQYAEEKKKFD